MTFALAPLVDAVPALSERARPRGRTCVVGLSGPQGCGKSTLAAAIVAGARARGRSAAALSIDDLYLTRDEQIALAARHPGNPYLEHRGYPGTHDVGLGASTLRALRGAGASDVVPLPSYDKSAHAGRGDRRPRSAWPVTRGPVELVVLEGWMLGFPVLDVAALAALEDRCLAEAAALLPRYDAWTRELDAFVHLDAADPTDVVRWRVDAERARRDAGTPALSDAEARDYVERFLPAYALWVPRLRRAPPSRDGAPLPSLRVVLGADRAPLDVAAAPIGGGR
jgi:D-glycerate 3-kinase